jgi:uncharacterized delta-60 repeat protein
MAFRFLTLRAPSRRPSYRPRLEALEERCVPSAGDLDTTFNGTGTATYNFGGNSQPHDVVMQTDGKIVMVGHLGLGSTDFALARFNADGSLDTNFGSSGAVVTDFNKHADAAYAVAISSDGKILAAGSANNSADNNTDFALARYNANGTLDTTFGSGKNKGKFTTDMGGVDIIYDMAIQTDGKILVAGQTTNAQNKVIIALARYTSSGSLDTTFGTGGKVITSIGIASGSPSFIKPVGMALQSDGRIVIATRSDLGGGAVGFLVSRFNANGSADTSFGSGGQVTNDFVTGFTDGADTVVVQGDGKIVAGGTTGTDGGGTTNSYLALARYNANGTLDSTSGAGGFVSTTQVLGAVTDMALQSDGKIVVGGNALVGRYTANGTVDTTFAPTSSTLGFAFATGTVGSSLTLQTDGKLVGVGGPNFTVSRFLNDGLPAALAAAAASRVASDQFFADMRAVSLLLSADEHAKKH